MEKKTKTFKTPEQYNVPPMPPVNPAATTETITIPLAEYVYLQRQAALLDVIVSNPGYVANDAVQAVVETVKDMRGQNEAGGDQ